jgi:hypothetical protein
MFSEHCSARFVVEAVQVEDASGTGRLYPDLTEYIVDTDTDYINNYIGLKLEAGQVQTEVWAERPRVPLWKKKRYRGRRTIDLHVVVGSTDEETSGVNAGLRSRVVASLRIVAGCQRRKGPSNVQEAAVLRPPPPLGCAGR